MNSKKLVQLIYITLAGIALIIGMRVLYSGERYGMHLLWNLFLAWVPLFVANIIRYSTIKHAYKYFLLLPWLAFLPNAPYIITDLYHLAHHPELPQWYDLTMIFLAAWIGLWMGILSIYYVEHFLLSRYSIKKVHLAIAACILMSGFGVYAGRYLRWNSWELLSNPISIVRDVYTIMVTPQAMQAAAVTIMFSVIIAVCYYTFKSVYNAK